MLKVLGLTYLSPKGPSSGGPSRPHGPGPTMKKKEILLDTLLTT